MCNTIKSFLLSLLLLVIQYNVQAATLLDVSGANDATRSVTSDEAVVVSFILDQDFNNVTFSAPITCLACSGEIYLMKDTIGTTSTILDAIDFDDYNLSSTTDLFTGLNLLAGDYYFILGIDSGSAIWSATTASTITTSTDVFYGYGDMLADPVAGLVYQSDFDLIIGGDTLLFAVSTAVVPVPAAAWLFGSGLLGLVGLARRKKA